MNKIQLHLYVENHCKECEYYNTKVFQNNPVCSSFKNLRAANQTNFMYLDQKPYYRLTDPYPQEICHKRNSKIS